MSGPKSYSPPPPRYSVEVFEGKLHEIFTLQNVVAQVWRDVESFSIKDLQRGIVLDSSGIIATYRAEVAALLAPFALEQRGTFGQKRYKELEEHVGQRLELLRGLLHRLESERVANHNLRSDYESFLSLEAYQEQVVRSFAMFRSRMCAYLQTYLEGENPDLSREAVEAIMAIPFAVPKPEFQPGFESRTDLERQRLDELLKRAEGAVNEVRARVSGQALQRTDAKGEVDVSMLDLVEHAKHRRKVPEVLQIVQQLQHVLGGTDDVALREEFLRRGHRLLESHSLTDLYFYQELAEDFRIAEQSSRWKRAIRQEVERRSREESHPELSEQLRDLQASAAALLGKARLKSRELNAFQAQGHAFDEENSRRLQEDFVRRKEIEFLKQQLVEGLRARNYEVATDLEVIDLDSPDMLLRNAAKDHYLNLAFGEDGSFIYRFMIPEPKESLSFDQKDRRVSEMKSACDALGEVLSELDQLGLSVKRVRAQPVSETALISLPEKHSRLLTAAKRKQARQAVVDRKLQTLD